MVIAYICTAIYSVRQPNSLKYSRATECLSDSTLFRPNPAPGVPKVYSLASRNQPLQLPSIWGDNNLLSWGEQADKAVNNRPSGDSLAHLLVDRSFSGWINRPRRICIIYTTNTRFLSDDVIEESDSGLDHFSIVAVVVLTAINNACLAIHVLWCGTRRRKPVLPILIGIFHHPRSFKQSFRVDVS